MAPVPPLDEKTLKSYPYFWNWIQELERDWQDVVNMSIQSTPIEVPSDNEWRHYLPNPEFTATLTFSNGDNFCRIGKWTEGKMIYKPEEPLVFTEEDFSLISPLPKCPCTLAPDTKGDE